MIVSNLNTGYIDETRYRNGFRQTCKRPLSPEERKAFRLLEKGELPEILKDVPDILRCEAVVIFYHEIPSNAKYRYEELPAVRERAGFFDDLSPVGAIA